MYAYCNNNPVSFEDASGKALKPCTTFINDGNKALAEPEPDPLTVSIGASASITLGPIVYGAQIALVTDNYGVSEYQFTFFTPISSDALKQKPTPDEMLAKVAKYEKITDLVGFSLMGNVSVYNTPNVENLYDMGYQVGGAIGAGGAIAVDYNIIPNGNGTPYQGITISTGMGSTDLHASMGSTGRIGSSIVSVYDLADVICRGLYGGY